MNKEEKRDLVTSLEERMAYLEAMVALEKALGGKGDGKSSIVMPFMEGYLSSGEERFYGSKTAIFLIRLKAARINTDSFPRISEKNLKDIESNMMPMFQDHERKLSELEAKRYGGKPEALKERIRWMRNELEAEL